MTRPLFTLGMFADCQYADADSDHVLDPSGSGRVIIDRYYRESLAKLQTAIAEFNRLDVDAIINLGDLVDRRFADTAPVLQLLDTARAPVWSVAGNHDFADSSASLSAVFAALRMPSGYYEKTLGGYRFLFVDSNEVGVIQHAPGSEGHREGRLLLERLRASGAPQAHEWNGGVGRQQQEWMREQLTIATRQNERAVILSHHPFHPVSSHNMLNDGEIRALVEAGPGVAAAFSGHDHAGNFALLGAVPCLTMRGMVEHESNSFAVAAFYADRIEITGYGRERSVVLTVR